MAEILAMGQRIDALGEDLEKLEGFKRRMPEMRGNEDKIIQVKFLRGPILLFSFFFL